ncbi:MAG TPA: hypothetical protein VFH51_10050 [Myxococcota bacterium]|nr:hypothetical protein [Myxococcota bacterium]
MNARQVLGASLVCCCCGGATACGTDVNSQITPAVAQQQALEIQLNDATQARIRATFERMRDEGVLRDPDIWQLQREPPAGVSMGRMTLHNDADDRIMDGYAYAALVPAGRRPSATPTQFFIERVGGFAGLRFIAGPFSIDAPH